MSDTFDSTADERVRNDVMRHEYRVLSEEEKLQLKELKDLGADFVALCRKTGTSRELALAVTKMEEAVFWAVKHVTGPKP